MESVTREDGRVFEADAGLCEAERTTNARALKAFCAGLRGRFPPNGRLLLVQLPQVPLAVFDPDVARRRGYFAFPPTALQCLYESVKHRGLEVRILDLNLELLRGAAVTRDFDPQRWLELLDAELEQFKPALVGVSAMFDAQIETLLAALELLRRRGDAAVVTGGVLPTFEGERLLREDLCHFVVRGEGEVLLKALLDALVCAGAQPVPPAGLLFKHDGRLVETDGNSVPVRFTSDMIESYALVPIEDYARYGSLNPFSRMSGRPFAAVQLNRGCRAACSFCSVPGFMGRGVRMRPVDAVFREIEYLVTKRGVRHFEWLDDDLLFQRRNVLELLGRIAEREWGITWAASNGLIARSLDKEVLDAMRASGCVGFRVGIETGNEALLKAVRKPGTLDIFRRTGHLVHGYPEIFVTGLYMIGFPDETFARMMDTFRFILELGLDWSGISTCQPIRGAGLFAGMTEVFEKQMQSRGATVRNYVPVRRTHGGRLTEGEAAVRGPAIFELPREEIPSAAQIEEIWFAFNLTANYLNNRNLMPGGNPAKFVQWVETAQIPYPPNPYMQLFLAFAYRLLGDAAAAAERMAAAREASRSDYWRERLAAFGLADALASPPDTAETVRETIRRLREQSRAWVHKPVEAGKQ